MSISELTFKEWGNVSQQLDTLKDSVKNEINMTKLPALQQELKKPFSKVEIKSLVRSLLYEAAIEFEQRAKNENKVGDSLLLNALIPSYKAEFSLYSSFGRQIIKNMQSIQSAQRENIQHVADAINNVLESFFPFLKEDGVHLSRDEALTILKNLYAIDDSMIRAGAIDKKSPIATSIEAKYFSMNF